MSTSAQTEEAPPYFSIENGSSLSDQVYDFLANQIARGIIRFGDRLNIKQIAAELHVSSMPIRDAVKRLEQDGIVVIYPRSHCYVRTPRKKDVLDAIDARSMIEHFAVFSLCEKMRHEDFTLLDSILAEMSLFAESKRKVDTQEDLERYIELDRQFHYELCRLTGNTYIQQYYQNVNMHLSMSFRYGQGACHGPSATFSEHSLLVRYLKEHSPKAVEIIDSHLAKSRENIIKEPDFLALPE